MAQRPANGPMPPGTVTVRAEFTRDMLRNLAVVVEAACGNRPVTLEMSPQGIWAVTPDGCRIFIGRTPRVPEMPKPN